MASQVGLLQAAHSWANAGVLLGARVRRRVAFETMNYRDEVSERKVIVNKLIGESCTPVQYDVVVT